MKTSIKVLPKAFGVLEYVYARDEPALPQDVARELAMPTATAMRILHDLAELGYLEQPGPRKGYRRGPMAFALAGSSPEDEYIRFADFHCASLARRMKLAVVLARRHRNWRCLLSHHNHNPSFVVDAGRLRLPNLYRNTSGRILLAYADPGEVDEVVLRDGPPSRADWPEAAGKRALLDQCLARIRDDGFVERNPSCNGQSHAFALPLFRHDALFGAVSVYWSLHADEIQSDEFRQAARQLVRTLAESPKTIPG